MHEIHEEIEEFLTQNGFRPDRKALASVLFAFGHEATEALAGAPSSLRMLDSHLAASAAVATQTDGSVIVVDAGGTNLRVAAVRLTEDGPEFSHVRTLRMPGSEGRISATDLHRAVAVEVNAVRAAEPSAVCIGYCFSYECRSLPDHDAELVAWSKQIDAPEVIGQHVGAELVRHLEGTRLPVVVLNDTVATLLAGLSRRGTACPGQIGFILGTGTNLACIENGTVRNAESGECDKVPRTCCDVALDETLPDKGAALFEKMVSGGYLGDVGLLLLKRAAAAGLLAGGSLASLATLQTCDLDGFAVGEGLSENPLVSALPPEDADVAQEIARAVFRRAALLTAAHLAAFVRRSAESGRVPVRITVDGSTYWKVRSVNFDAVVRETLACLVPDVPFEIVRIDNAPMVGAAVAAAILRSNEDLPVLKRS